MAPKVAVIGAGASGLCSIKEALDAGLEPTAYEKASWLGGIWNFSEDPEQSCAALCTITNTSKHVMCFSDFPMSKTCPNYLPMKTYQAYLESYAKEFNLVKNIRFNVSVIEVKKCADFEETGKWEVHSIAGNSQTIKMEVYDFVMVASGKLSEPFIPEIPGMESFPGKLIHSKEYKTFRGFENRRILVVGLGNSAGDIACELSRHASQVYISTRRGTWVLPRLGPGGAPIDLSISRLVYDLPRSFLSWVVAQRVKGSYNLANFGLETGEEPMKALIINDELPHRIVTGSVIVKSDIKSIKGSSILFSDDTTLDDIDIVIFATGFNVRYPFLSNSWLQPKEDYIPLYKFVFPFEPSKPTIAIIGAFTNEGPIPPCCEMQARWVVQVFKGNARLPDKQKMIKEILDAQEEIKKRVTYTGNRYFHKLKGMVPYLDEIGSLIGARPSMLKLALKSPALALKCYFGTCIPAQYRLVGPGAWGGAEKVIWEVEESFLTPMKTRAVSLADDKGKSKIYLFMFGVIIVLVACWLACCSA
ncbi:flavin-containing monooxygenase 2 [Nematostella vectensis]|uniref:flavin-containing monooxygenase 2 n=1 Tax=Nematostella vectensis TaxID=45351 RepID=UPI002076FF68|nr:flavin-containing monooxygenase 2 [Nematostella vectensis]